MHQSPSLSPHLVPQFPTFTHLLCAPAHVLTRIRARVGLLVLHNFSQGVHFFRKSFFGACVIKKPF